MVIKKYVSLLMFLTQIGDVISIQSSGIHEHVENCNDIINIAKNPENNFGKEIYRRDQVNEKSQGQC